MFHVQDLTFTYPQAGAPSLSHVSLSVAEGEYLCICGRSGCGKTTLLRHLKSVLTPHGRREGQVLFCETPLQDVPEQEQASRIGFVMQDPDAQIVTDKVWHELAFGLENLGYDPATMRVRVAEMASYFGMQDWFHRSVAKLSGGQKQLLNLASVLTMQPDVLVFDEPTSQLDPIAAADLLSTIRKVNRELGTTVIITEHRLEDAYASADTVVVMEEGRIIAHGSPRFVAERLYAAGDDMTFALPSPVRVFYGVEGTTKQEPERCPLTVREGRTWLAKRTTEHPPHLRSLPEDAPEPCDDAVVRMEGVWFRYERDGRDVLRDVNLKMPRGQLFAIVGGNGAGKSTLLKSICGAVKAYRGKIWVLGRPLKQWKGCSLFHGGVAMLPQDPQNLFVKKTVQADLEEMLTNTSLNANEKQRRLDEIMALCNLDGLTDMHPFDLSGGEQQRAALAKVLLTEPRVLLLDEPTKGIDSFFKRTLAQVLHNLTQKGVTVIMVSHDVEFCARHADAVSLFFDGSLVTTNTPRRFFASNSFYTTAANRMSRNIFANAITDEDVVHLCLS